MDSSDDQMLASFSGTLFDWSRAWGLKSSDSLPTFLCSLSSFVISLLFGFFYVSLCFPFLVFSQFTLCCSCIELPFVYISFLLIKKKKKISRLVVLSFKVLGNRSVSF